MSQALAFGADGLQGDSAFYAGRGQAIHTEAWHLVSEPFAFLIGQWLRKNGEGCTDIELWRDRGEAVPVGFWILADDERMCAVDAVWDAADPRGDSSTYAANAAAKAVAATLAHRVIWTKNERDLIEYHLQGNGWQYGYTDTDYGEMVAKLDYRDLELRICASFSEDMIVQLSLVGEDLVAVQVEFGMDELELFVPAKAMERLERELSGESEVPEEITVEALGHMRRMLGVLVGANQVHVAAGFLLEQAAKVPVSGPSDDQYTLMGHLFRMLDELAAKKPSG